MIYIYTQTKPSVLFYSIMSMKNAIILVRYQLNSNVN